MDRLPQVHGDWHEFESKIRRHESKKGTVAVAPRAPSPQPSSLSSLQAPISEKYPDSSISPSKRVDSLAAKSASYEFMDTSQPDMAFQKSPLEGRGRMDNMDADSIKRRSESLDQDQLRKKHRHDRSQSRSRNSSPRSGFENASKGYGRMDVDRSAENGRGGAHGSVYMNHLEPEDAIQTHHDSSDIIAMTNLPFYPGLFGQI